MCSDEYLVGPDTLSSVASLLSELTENLQPCFEKSLYNTTNSIAESEETGTQLFG